MHIPVGRRGGVLTVVVALLWAAGASYPLHSVTAAPIGTTVSRWQTSQAGDRLTAKTNLTFAADGGSSLPTIQVTPTRYYQAIDGFGGTFNEAGWVVLSTLNQAARSAVLAQLFDPTQGAGFSLTRVPMGGDDFSCVDLNNTCPHYTYDDIAPGTTDFSMSQFSISRDLQRLIPFIQAAQAEGTFRVFGSPWSAPAWMKTNGSLTNGGSVIEPNVDARYYQAYALYFQKYVEAYAAEGVPIDFVSIQNEPQNQAAYMSTLWSSSQMATFVGSYLGPQFVSNDVPARIRIYEHNRDTWQYPKEVLDNSSTAPYVAGVNYHDYECMFGQTYCMAENTRLFTDSHPGYSVWMSEMTDVDVPDPSDYLNGEKWGNWILDDVRSGMSAYVYWNLVLAMNGGPVDYPLSSYQDPLVAIDTATGTVNYMPRYWYLAQFSKYVRPGAYRIGADGGQLKDGLSFAAFKNADGSEVLVVVNSNASAVQIKVREDGNVIEPTLDAHSINTFRWNAPVNTYHVIAGGGSTWNSVSSDPYGPDAYYSGGGTATNTVAIDGTADDPLYQPERNGNFSYAFPVPNGRYAVTLKLSENYWNCANCRKFHVDIEGARVLSDFDIYAAAGGRYKALDRTFTSNVTDGTLNVTFTTVTDNAKVDAIAIMPLPVDGSPFTTITAPGFVMAQDYNIGGEGYAYHFGSAGGTDGSYRSDATHLEVCSNDSPCGDNLGWLSTGDWVNHTVNIAVGGNYDVRFRVASPNGSGVLALDLDGTSLVGSTAVPNTGGWQSWTDVWAYGVALRPGTHTLRFRVVAGGFNLHYFVLHKVHTLDALPATVEAEWYGGGGEGVGYHDTTSANSFTSPYAGYFRPEGVDLEIASTQQYDIGQTADGEWVRIDVWNPSARTFTVGLAVASTYTSGRIRLDLDNVGNTIGSTLSVPNTGGWQSWQTITEQVSLPAGTHALYVFIPVGGFNLNYVTFS